MHKGRKRRRQMQDTMMEQFVKWFKAQYGKSPQDLRPQHKILEDLISARKKVSELERELYEQRRISYSFEAALYSRNAGEKKYEF
jgi:hypothetical protein